MGFDAGDSNLYRYVQNRVSQFSDPSGLVAWTEASARTVLENTRKGWIVKGYSLAPHLLEHFLTKTGAPFTYTDEDIKDFQLNAGPMIRKLLTQELANSNDFWGALGSKKSVSFINVKKVRWVSPAWLGLGDAIQAELRGLTNPDFILVNPSLFNAYGGATLGVKGSVFNIKGSGRSDVELEVGIVDDWTFLPKGPFEIRLKFEAYAAAHFLETTFPTKYKSFKHGTSFKLKLIDFSPV